MIYSISRYTEVPYYFMDKFMAMLDQQLVTFKYEQSAEDGSKKEAQTEITFDPTVVSGLYLWSKCWENYLPYKEVIESQYRVIYNHSAPLLPIALSGQPFFGSVESEIVHLVEMADMLGNRLVWHLSPILVTSATPTQYWVEMFSQVLKQLKKPKTISSMIDRIIISLYDPTPRSEQRLFQHTVSRSNITFTPLSFTDAAKFIKKMADMAKEQKIEVHSCMNPYLIVSDNMKSAACIDNEIMNKNCIGSNNLPWPAMNLYPPDPEPPDGFTNCKCVRHLDLGFLFDECPGKCLYCNVK